MQCTSQDDDAEHDAMDGIIEEIRKLRPIDCMYLHGSVSLVGDWRRMMDWIDKSIQLNTLLELCATNT